MSKVEVDFGGWIQKGFELYKTNFVTILLSTLIAGLLSSITLGVLAGPLYAGLFMVVLGLLDGQTPPAQPGDVFKGFQCFLPAFLVVLIVVGISIVASIVPVLGPLVALAVNVLFLFSIPLIADGRAREIGPALKMSIETVKQNYLPLLALALVSNIVAGIGVLACGIGVLVTMPLAVCIVAVAYRAHFPREAA